jgi:hypothetical protein
MKNVNMRIKRNCVVPPGLGLLTYLSAGVKQDNDFKVGGVVSKE